MGIDAEAPGGASVRPPPPAPGPGERRPLAVLFADLAGSTALLEALGPEAYDERLRHFHATLAEAVRRHGGTVAQYQGDGLIAQFGHPRAAEDDAERAVAAALDAIEDLDRGGGPPARIGVATGPVLLRGGGEPFGAAAVGACVNRAARLQALAPEGAVLICAVTRRLVGGLFEVDRPAEAELRGFARREAVFRVRGRRAGISSRFEALRGGAVRPLVGRDRELARLLGMARAARGGRGGAVLISGEPGLGKSRLLAALREHPEAAALRVFVLQCAPEHAATALHPVREYLGWVAGAARGDGPAARHEKLRRLFERAWRASPEEVAWLLDELSPLGSGRAEEGAPSAPLRRRRAFETLGRMILRSAAGREALVCAFEDAHWMDPSTAEFVRILAAMAAGRPLLVLLTTRPEPPFGAGAPGFDLLRLDRLDAGASAALARAATAPDLPAAALALVLDRADGVPLYIEEVADTLSEAVAAGRRIEEVEVPATVGGLVQGRFDRLGPAAQRLAQAAAALGRRADGRVASAVAGLDGPEAEAAARDLEAARLVRRAGADPGLEFSHALVRDAIYGTLDGPGRRAIHARVADRHLASGAAPMPDEVLADHLFRGGRPEAAIERWQRAGVAATAAGATREALALFDHALGAVAALPPGRARDRWEFAVRAAQGPALGTVIGGPGSPGFGEAHGRALELMDGDDAGLDAISVVYNSALHDWARARHAQALLATERLDRMVRAGGDEAPRLGAFVMRGLVWWHVGRTRDAAGSLAAALRRYEAERHRIDQILFLKELDTFSHFYLGLAETVLGRFASGARHAERALALADRMRRPHAQGFGFLAHFTTAWLRDDPEAAADWSARGRAFATEQGFPEFVALARFVAGWAACRRGQLDAGLPEMEAAAADWDATGFRSWQPLMAAHRARHLVEAGALDRAEALLDRFDAVVAETGEAQAAAPLRLARAELLRARGDLGAARAEARAAARVARAQSGVAWLRQVEASGLLA